ncbi:hypothetical protein JXA80_00855 [bacterium]|nr:hypothetical protein [candidate division CSSED10-310 bacterium]
MHRQSGRPIRLLIFIFLTGVFIGCLFRLIHANHHHLTIFYSPERMEAYIDGECLNMAHPLPVKKPRIEIFFHQMLQRPHEVQFFQLFTGAVIRESSRFSPIWRSGPHSVPTWASASEWAYPILHRLGIEKTAGFGHFQPLFLDNPSINLADCVLEIDCIMPTSIRIHFVDSDSRNRNIFNADVFSGCYGFALNDTWEWTQRYLINPSMPRQLRTIWTFRMIIGAFFSILLIGLTACLTGLLLIPIRMIKTKRTRVRDDPPDKTLPTAVSPKTTGAEKNESPGGHSGSIFWMTGGVVVLAFFAAYWVSSSVFNHTPRVNDEAVYLFQAKVFASGRWFIPPPQPIPCFKHLGIWWEDRVFSYYTYGHSLILAAGYRLGLLSLIPALCTAMTVLATIRIGLKLTGARWTGPAAGILLVSSPLFILLGGSYMSHISAAAASSVFILCMIRASSFPSNRHALTAGLSFGILFVIRPVTALVFATGSVCFFALSCLRRRKLRPIALFALTCLLIASTTCAHAWFTTGRWELIQYQVEDRFSTGNDTATFWKYLQQNTTWFLMRGFGWIPYMTLMFAFLPIILRSKNPWDWIFILTFSLNGCVYSALAHFGWTHEPRYWSECMPLIALVSTRGIDLLGEKMAIYFNTAVARRIASALCIVCILGLVIGSLTMYWPYEMAAFSNYCNVRDETIAAVRQNQMHHSIMLFRGPPDYIYIPFFHLNRIPDFSGDVIYAMDYSAEATRELMEMHPERSVFLVESDQPVRRIR